MHAVGWDSNHVNFTVYVTLNNVCGGAGQTGRESGKQAAEKRSIKASQTRFFTESGAARTIILEVEVWENWLHPASVPVTHARYEQQQNMWCTRSMQSAQYGGICMHGCVAVHFFIGLGWSSKETYGIRQACTVLATGKTGGVVNRLPKSVRTHTHTHTTLLHFRLQ